MSISHECDGCRRKAEAGRYTYVEAIVIVRLANQYCGDDPHEAMILDL